MKERSYTHRARWLELWSSPVRAQKREKGTTPCLYMEGSDFELGGGERNA